VNLLYRFSNFDSGSIAINWIESRHLLSHTAGALGLIWWQAVLLPGVTMACSTHISALTSAVCALGLYGSVQYIDCP
jgi:hypothetical protein